jgi:predicted small lipoprotein YifL
MKKLRTLLLLSMLLILAACGGKKENPVPEETVKPVDFETQLRLDAFPEGDLLMEQVGSAVSFKDIKDQGDRISFTLQAPEFSEELINWYTAQSDVSEAQLQEKIFQLLRGEKRDTAITLECTVGEDGTVHFRYTEEYLNAAGCGLRQFYTHMYDLVLGQMGGEMDG